MKELIIMRHAKTEEAAQGQSDFDRTLLEKGVLQSAMQANKLKKMAFSPDKILISPAARTKQTCMEIFSVTGWNKNIIKENKSLYMASTELLLNTIAEEKDTTQKLMLLGHNFGVAQLVEYLSNKMLKHFKTGTFAYFKFDIASWSQLSSDNASLISIEKATL